ncbi:helicase [Galbitalea sp. SE-J8]|uniref:helicase n=1 Tax=Galbitalea sp. SE-J8 TaxID=3054952 RepID=UPI00259D2BA6|nr:helicase [Galbitalea sp. SE-J8]
MVAASVALLALAVPLYTVLAGRSRIAATADASALAAADAASGAIAGEPCTAAKSVARGNGARLDACVVDGLVVTVRATASIGGLAVAVAATAGPPGTR